MANDLWQTPPELIAVIEKWINMPILLDVCATETNTVCDAYISEAANSLRDEIPWTPPIRGGVAWMNPPYSNITPWVEKADRESLQRGIIVVGLLPEDSSTKWYQQHVNKKAAIILKPTSRIKFIDPETGKPKGGNPKGSIIPIWFPFRIETTQTVTIDI